MLTSRGLWFLLTIVAVLFAGLFAEATTLIVLGLTLLLWFLVAWFFFVARLRLVQQKLRVERELADARGAVESLWAGRSFSVRVSLACDHPVGIPYIRITERVPLPVRSESLTHQRDGVVAPDEPLSITYTIECPSPGIARFEGLHCRITDLQGWFLTDVFVREAHEYRILPTIAEARGHSATTKRHNLLPFLGTHRHRRAGSGSELLDLREYRPGDPPKTIAWKVTARRDRLMTKEFESEVPVRCTLFMDVSDSVRVGTVGQNALSRLVEIAASVAQAGDRGKDLTGLCLFDQEGTRIIRAARGRRHLTHVLNLLADAAALQPSAARMSLDALLPLAYGTAQEIYPDLLHASVNAWPWWLPLWSPQPAYTLSPASWSWRKPLGSLRGWLGLKLLAVRQNVLARFGPKSHRRYRRRKKLAALLAVRHELGAGGLAWLLEDDRACAEHAQRFLAEHQIPFPLPYYDPQGRYQFAAPEKVAVLAKALLHAVRRGRDNELFVLMVDLLEVGGHLGPLLRAVKVARARHHQVMMLFPWPSGLPLPTRKSDAAAEQTLPDVERKGWRKALQGLTSVRLQSAYYRLRRTFARMGVTVICAGDQEAVPLILDRLERLRIQERGVR